MLPDEDDTIDTIHYAATPSLILPASSDAQLQESVVQIRQKVIPPRGKTARREASRESSSSLSSAPSTPILQKQERISVRQLAKAIEANKTKQQSVKPRKEPKPRNKRVAADASRRSERTSANKKQKTDLVVVPIIEKASHIDNGVLPVKTELETTLPPSTTDLPINPPVLEQDSLHDSSAPNGVDAPQPPPVEEPQESHVPNETNVENAIPASEPGSSKSLKRRRGTKNMPEPSLPPSKKIKTIECATSGVIERQTGSCHSSRYAHTQRCLACIAKKTGEPCRFKGVRAFLIGTAGQPTGDPIWYGYPGSDVQANDGPVILGYNQHWYELPQTAHIRRIKMSAARVLLPVLRTERDVLIGKEAITIRRKREMDVRVTCDRCLTSIFSTSFLCTLCGREFCIDCHSRLENVTGHPVVSSQSTLLLVACGPLKSARLHQASHFLPISRLGLEELQSHIEEMQTLLQDEPEFSTDTVRIAGGHGPSGGSSITEGKDDNIPAPAPDAAPLDPIANSNEGQLQDVVMDHTAVPDAVPVEQMERVTMSDNSVDSTDVAGSLEYRTFQHSELTEDVFRELWKDGQMMVVSGLLEKMSIQWTPEYFIQNFGSQSCFITDCDTESVGQSIVRDFFSQFGRYSERAGKILKLKDWPPSADFKTAFPALFEDFQNAVPAPNYTRRDGFYNVSSHFPLNAIAPDMGPKMYNAFTSRENGYGSTRLHMDMADAVNIMLYSAPLPDQQVGVAVWDIYPSKFANDIRAFLKEEYPVETSPVFYIDPIHSQHFYLTPPLRKKLFDKYGVKSWRIYQKPGDAVFIPAGCAHQVCNLADCVKVAVDFVSPENLDRCSQLTQEFRNENERVTWKDDILQLSNMCWSAWEHTRQLESTTTS